MQNPPASECSISGGGKKTCPVKCFVVSSVVAFVVLFVAEMIFHHGIMMEHYAATASLWRPEADMQSHMSVMIVRQIVTAMVFVCIYGWVKKGCCENECPVKIGLKVGGKLGALLGVTYLGMYVWLPFPNMEIPLMWLIGYIIIGMLVGASLGIVCKIGKKRCDKNNAAAS